jgi:hypothetical protein
MALLNSMIRNAAITGSTDSINDWLVGRQGGRWALQTVRGAMPAQASHARPGRPAAVARPAADPGETLERLNALRDRGIVTEAEAKRLRARLGV